MPTTPAAKELDWLLALIEFQRSTGWLDQDDLDDQAKCLALAYTMQSMQATCVIDVNTSINPRLRPDAPGQSGLGAFWVYGLEIVDGEGRHFVGVNGERSRFEAEQSVVYREAPGAPPWRRPIWEERKVVFQSLQAAQAFYTGKTYKALTRLVGEGCSHLLARDLGSGEAGPTAPRARL